MEIEDGLEDIIKERLGENSSEIMHLMRVRTTFANDLVKHIIDSHKPNFPNWLYKNEGEVGIVQLLLPEGMADLLKQIGEEHKERCESCAKLEVCKKAGIYDDPVRVALTEIFKLGFSTMAEQALRDKF